MHPELHHYPIEVIIPQCTYPTSFIHPPIPPPQALESLARIITETTTSTSTLSTLRTGATTLRG